MKTILRYAVTAINFPILLKVQTVLDDEKFSNLFPHIIFCNKLKINKISQFGTKKSKYFVSKIESTQYNIKTYLV